MKTIIELKNVNVCYDYGKTNEITAIKNINLEIFEGEYVVFFGPSGCGKSTLLYTIAGLESATSGDVIVAGKKLKDICSKDLISFYRDTIGMVFQAFYLVGHLSAKDNMMLSKMFSGISAKDREKRADELMEKFGITNYAHHKPNMMSGGQQQRTAIARALMNDPEIILADEPVGNLDSVNSEIVLKLLAKINKEDKKTIIQVTHNPKDTQYADRVFYMKDGQIEKIVENNPDRRKVSNRGEISEYEKLAEANPELSHSRLKAKLLMRFLLMPYDIDTEHKIEEIIEKYLKKDISKSELIRFIDDSKNGIGLYSQKARSISDLIDDSAREMENIENIRLSKLSQSKQIESEAIIIRRHLLDSYKGNLSPLQIDRLHEGIEARLSGKLFESSFYKFLDSSIKDGGVGLNKFTAKNFSKEVEMVISK